MKIKKLAAITLAMIMACFLAACGGSNTAGEEEDSLSRVLNAGKLVAAIEVGSEPFSYMDTETNEYVGFNIDLMQDFCDSIGVELELVPMEFSELFESLNSEKVDMATANISRTKARSATCLFTEPVTHSLGIAMVSGESGLTSIDELNDSSKTVIAPSGGVYLEIAEEQFPDASIEGIGSSADAIAALKAGRADAYLTDTNTSSVMMEDDSSLAILPEPISVDTVAFALKMEVDSYTLRDAFNNYLKVIKLDGSYNDLCEKWYGAEWEPLTTEYGA